MNILTDKLPTQAVIEGKAYRLNTDYRNCLKIILAFEDRELTIQEKYLVMLELLYEEIPANKEKAIRFGVLFLNCGEEDKASTAEERERVFSFKKDAKYIYSSISQSMSIDLESIEHLHWWKFCYLFSDIKEDTFFSRLVYLRHQKNTGKLTKEEREYVAKIQDIIDIPKDYSPEEIKAKNKFMDLLNSP